MPLGDVNHGIKVVSILAAANNSHAVLEDVRFSGILASVYNLPYHVLFYRNRANTKWWEDILEEVFGNEEGRMAAKWERILEKLSEQIHLSEFYSALEKSALDKATESSRVLNISIGCDQQSRAIRDQCKQVFEGAVQTFGK